MHVCPDSGGANHFHEDENGVRLCSCGEVELSMDDQINLAIIRAGAFEPLPEPRRSWLYCRIRRIIDGRDDGVS